MKRGIYFFVLVFVFSINYFTNLFAQDYKLINAGQVQYFQRGNIYANVSTNYSAYPGSNIIATRFDSITSSGNDSIFYPFRTFGDIDLSDTVCGDINGPSWMGISIQEFTDSTYLFNYENDTILIVQSSIMGQSWTMMHLDSGYLLKATVDSIFIFTCAGITDSVKQIHISIVDSNSIPVAGHPINQIAALIWLSKMNGFFKAVSFRDLPSYYEMNRSDSIPILTYGDIYDFDIGDEYEYHIDTAGGFINSYDILHRIIDKWYSSPDTVYYVRNNFKLASQYNPNPPYNWQYIYSSNIDTIHYSQLHVPVYTEVPEQNTNLHFTIFPTVGMYSAYGVYTLSIDSIYYNGRPVFAERTGNYMFSNQCVYFITFEPFFYYGRVSPGLGIVYSGYDLSSQTGPRYTKRLNWYRKGIESWGNYIQVISGIDELINENTFQVYPNPGNEKIILQYYLPKAGKVKLSIVDISGKIVKEQTEDMKNGLVTSQINFSDLSAGIYFLHLNADNMTKSKRFIKE